MSQKQNNQGPARGFGRRMTIGEKVWCVIWTIAIVLFAVWMGMWIPLIILPFVIDVYYTKFIPWTWWKNIKNGFLRSVMSWVDAIVFALLAVWVLQNFFFQNFQIPTTSLEKTMLAGDYLLVSKYQYGPRVPMTPLSLPIFHHTIDIAGHQFGQSYLEKPQVDYRRMPGINPVQRYDIVVFNYPSGDTVATNFPNMDYYQLRFEFGAEELHGNPARFGEIIYRPVDRRENYVKRCVGLPGDTLQIVEDVVYIDGKPLKNPPYMQLKYFVATYPDKEVAPSTWRKLGVYMSDVTEFSNNPNFTVGQLGEALGFQPDTLGRYGKIYAVLLTEEMKNKLQGMASVVKDIVVCPAELFGKDYVYPLSHTNTWTHSDYGPVWIPQSGKSVELTPWNVEVYGRCIRNYEGNTLEQTQEGGWLLNGQPATHYTFQLDYYWMMGDNRDNSADSRYWGFVPEDHIVGTPLFVWFSIDQETGAWRKDRILKRVNGHAEL